MEAGYPSNLLLEIKNTIFPETTTNVGSSVRLRSKPIMNKVKKIYGSAYMLANISRNLSCCIQENGSIASVMALVRNRLCHKNGVTSDGSGFCLFDALQRQGMENLKQALVEIIADMDKNKGLTLEKPLSRVKQISVASIVNKRRRQEDRWFFEPDLVAYAPLETDDNEKLSRLRRHDYPEVIGCGVFDGHGGPEAAEHCSNLVPFLLSRRLQRRFLETSHLRRSSETIPDILTGVIHELNFSIAECHRNKLWSSGTTATICLVYGNHIYTCWIGDSQGVLFTTTDVKTKTKSATTQNLEETAALERPSKPRHDLVSSGASSIEETEKRKKIGHECVIQPSPLNLQSVDAPTSSAAALVSPTSPRTRATRWELSFSWLTSLVRGSSNSSKESSPSEVPPTSPRQGQVRAPLATQEVAEELGEDVARETSPAPCRYGSLPTKKVVTMREQQQSKVPVRATSKRLSAHFSEPSLAAPTEKWPETTPALSAGHRISPTGDLRGSRSTSVVEKPPSLPAPCFKVLTPCLHRPEHPVEFVSVLRTGGCITFKPSIEVDCETNSNEALRTDCTPSPVMSNAQLLYVPDLSMGGVYRVGGISGVTRSLGASSSMIPGLSDLPSLSVHRLSCVATCLILATDGLWDTYGCSPADLTHFFSGTPNREFAKLLTARAVRNGSTDNVTVLIIWLSEAGELHESVPMEPDLRSPCAYSTGTRFASVPCLGDTRLRGTVGGGFSDGEPSLPRYVEPQERLLSRSHSVEDLADVDRIRASSPMHVVP
uniref:PPM-type phosphatase domain-containing protein n=1 Tax=Mesocestoides corti TaxID=53468 RepID=A0A5K3EJT7_MESCO